MIVVIALFVPFILTFAIGFYFKRAEYYANEALAVWKRLNQNVNRLIFDERTTDELAREVAGFALLAGCGCFTRGLLIEIIVRSFNGRKQSAQTPHAIRNLPSDQRELLGRIMRDLLLYDSLRTPFIGFLMRRALLIYAPPDKYTSKMQWARVPILVRAAERIAERKRPLETGDYAFLSTNAA